VEYRYATGQSPSITCPPGFLMSSCVFWSMWTEYMPDTAKALVDSVGSVKVVSGQCAVPNCADTAETWCKLTAVCSKLTGDDYLKEACPSCDSVGCADGFECSMGTNNLPVCNEKIVDVSGCADPDICGSGTCIEVDITNYMCSCPSGYLYDGTTCTDINECSDEPCGGNGDCVNTEGGYSCDCLAGFTQSQGTCVDIDECLKNPCSATERCSNIDGSYICDCLETFYREGTECVCATGFELAGGACVDVNECLNKKLCTGLNQVCANSVGGYSCPCKTGYETSEAGVCTKYLVGDCGIKAKKAAVSSMAGNNVKVELKGKMKPAFHRIKWYKDGALADFSDAVDGKEPFKGFTLYDFQAEDAGLYMAEIYYNKPGLERKCKVEITVSMIEGSAVLDIANRNALAKNVKAGPKKSLVISCSVKLTNIKLANVKDPNNVDWYKVVAGEDDEKIEESEDGRITINKKKGTYRLFFKSTLVSDSGSYRCKFSQGNVEAATDVAISIV